MKRKITISVLLCVLVMALSISVFAGTENAHNIRVRVEGKDSILFNKVVNWDGEKSALEFFKETVGESNVIGDESAYGFMVTSLFDESGISGEGYSTSWGLYVDNGEGLNSASLGISTLNLENVKELLFHYKAIDSSYTNLTYLPRVEINNQILKVNKEITTYDASFNPMVSEEAFEGANVELNGKNYISDENGEIDLSFVKAGTYNVKVKKDGDNYPILIRSEFDIEKKIDADYPRIRVRVEGKDSTLFNKVVNWDGEKSALEFFKETVGESNVIGDESAYGFMVTSLFDESGISGEGYSTSWGLYVDNGEGLNSASLGISTLNLENVKELLFHYKAIDSSYTNLTYLPRVEINNQILKISKEIITYDDSWKPIVSEEAFKGAIITINDDKNNSITTTSAAIYVKLNDFDRKTYISDANGEIDLSHLQAGNYNVKIKKDGDNYPILIRSEFDITKKGGYSLNYSEINDAIKDLNDFYNLESTYSWRQAVGRVYTSENVSTNFYNLIESKFDLATSDSSAIYAGNIFGILASGRNPYDYMGVDHVKKLVDSQNEDGKFIIGPYDDHPATMSYVLLALDAVDADYNKTKAINLLLSNQDENGMIFDVDTTAMVLSGLSNHTDLKGVIEAIDKGFEYIKSQQQDNGGFIAWGSDNPYTEATVINALLANDRNVFSLEWSLNGKTIVDALMKYKKGNHFEYTSDYGTEINSVSEQVYIALSGIMKKQLAYNALTINKEEASRPENLVDVFKIERISSGSYRNGETARIEIKFTNNSLSNQEIMMVIGLYDKSSNELINYSYYYDTVNKSDSKSFGSGMLIPDSGNYKIKAFIWDSFESQRIMLTTPFEIDVKK